jgi:hypothetical protein
MKWSLYRFPTVLGVALLVACSSAPTGCGPPPPVAYAQLWLVYPIPGATGVSTSIGEVVFADLDGISTQVAILSPAGRVPVGTFTAAPSPLPSPRVTPGSQFGAGVPYVAAPVPTLSATTTYTVSFTNIEWADNPPSCQAYVTQTLGTFTTR